MTKHFPEIGANGSKAQLQEKPPVQAFGHVIARLLATTEREHFGQLLVERMTCAARVSAGAACATARNSTVSGSR